MAKPFRSHEDLLNFLQNDKKMMIEDFDATRHIYQRQAIFPLSFDNELLSIFLKYILIAEHSVKSSLTYHFSVSVKTE